MRAAIVEDEHEAAEKLKKFATQFSQEHQLDLEIDVFSDVEVFLLQQAGTYSLVFMDILMPKMDGLSAAKQLREKGSRAALIFVTNMAQMAIRGYEVDALDFMVKPVSYESFVMKMRHALRYLERFIDDSLVIAIPGGVRRFSIRTIHYIEVNGHYLVVHTTDGPQQVRGSLQAVEEKLKQRQFFRCNNCYLVNLGFVERTEGAKVIVAGVPLQMSRPRMKPFLKRLTEYWCEGGS